MIQLEATIVRAQEMLNRAVVEGREREKGMGF